MLLSHMIFSNKWILTWKLLVLITWSIHFSQQNFFLVLVWCGDPLPSNRVIWNTPWVWNIFHFWRLIKFPNCCVYLSLIGCEAAASEERSWIQARLPVLFTAGTFVSTKFYFCNFLEGIIMYYWHQYISLLWFSVCFPVFRSRQTALFTLDSQNFNQKFCAQRRKWLVLQQ